MSWYSIHGKFPAGTSFFLELTFIIICLYNGFKHKKTKHMRKKMTPKLLEMKKVLAGMVSNISTHKNKFKCFQQDFSLVKTAEIRDVMRKALQDYVQEITKLRINYRHMHIAYCELRGTSRDRIEKHSPRAEKLSENVISTYKIRFAEDG